MEIKFSRARSMISLLAIVTICISLSVSFVFASNHNNVQTFVGNLNIGHSHFEDGSSENVFYLFDYDSFSRPPIILNFDDFAEFKMGSELAGKKIIVRGVIISENPYWQLDVYGIAEFGETMPNTGSISLDRTVYPVPWGSLSDLSGSSTQISSSGGYSIFPIHSTGLGGTYVDSNRKILSQGDLTVHIRINDPDFDTSSNIEDGIAIFSPGSNTHGPIKISVTRGFETIIIATAGAPIPGGSKITVGNNIKSETRELGPIKEIAPDAGIFEYDLNITHTDGPSSSNCPDTDFYLSPVNSSYGNLEDELHRFDVPLEGNDYCILTGDILTVEYTDYSDPFGIPSIVSDSATFDLRNGKLQSDKSVYLIGSDIILTLIEPDLDLDNDAAETYDLDLIEWDSDAATVTMGNANGDDVAVAFDPEPTSFRETGDSTGIFQIIIEVPEVLQGDRLERGEEIVLEYTDWGPSGSDFVGDEDEDVNLTIYTSNFGATVELDQKVYTWTDKVYITIVAPDHNFDSDLVDEIGNTDLDPIKVASRGDDIDNYKLVETGTDTGIFTGEVILTGFTHDADGDSRTGDEKGHDVVSRVPSGTGPTDGLLPADDDDGITVSFEFSEDETVVGSALVRWNIGEVQWLEASYPASGTGVVRVIDPDMNLDPEAVDNYDVDVWSDSDAGGIDLTVTETNEATGIFEGTVFFTILDESSGHRLRVAEGDTVTAEYEDNTLPDPYTTADELDITATSLIGTVHDTKPAPKFAIVVMPQLISSAPNKNFFNFVTQVGYSNSDFSESIIYPSISNSKIIPIHHDEGPEESCVQHSFCSFTVLTKFKDLRYIPHEIDFFQNKFYADNNSLSEYFYQNSYEKFHIDGRVVVGENQSGGKEWIELEDSEDYVDSNKMLIHPKLIDDVISLIDEKIEFDGENDIVENNNEQDLWTKYQNTDDVDQLIIITNTESGNIPNPRAQIFSFLHPHKVQTMDGELYIFPVIAVDDGFGFPISDSERRGYGQVAHEMGHNLQWYHTPLLRPYGIYDDPWSLMSGGEDATGVAGPLAYQKSKAGWLNSDDVIVIEKNNAEIVTLDYLSNRSPSDNRYHMIKIPFGGQGQFYTVEAREESRFDTLPKSGIMIYQFNPNGFGSENLREGDELDTLAPISAANISPLCTPNDSRNCDTYDFSSLALYENQSFVDETNSISVEFVSESDKSITVEVTNDFEDTDTLSPTLNLEEIMAEVQTSEGIKHEPMTIDLSLTDLNGNNIEHITYNIKATHGSIVLLNEDGHMHMGTLSNHHTTEPLAEHATDSKPVVITIRSVGFGHDDQYRSVTGEIKTKQIVPEFGTISIMILTIAIFSIIGISVKTKLNIISK